MDSNKNDFLRVLPTSIASAVVNRAPQTMRKWSSLDCAPLGIRPIRINGRLAWRVDDLHRLLAGETQIKKTPTPIETEMSALSKRNFTTRGAR